MKILKQERAISNLEDVRVEFEKLFPVKDYTYSEWHSSYFSPDFAYTRRGPAQERYNAKWEQYREVRGVSTETVTTYELTQEEMYVLMRSAGLTCSADRQTCMTYEQARGFCLFYAVHIGTVLENQP